MRSLRSILALCMPAVYALAGLALLFTPLLSGTIVRWRKPLGVLLLGYGLVRAFLWWKRHRAAQGQP